MGKGLVGSCLFNLFLGLQEMEKSHDCSGRTMSLFGYVKFWFQFFKGQNSTEIYVFFLIESALFMLCSCDACSHIYTF